MRDFIILYLPAIAIAVFFRMTQHNKNGHVQLLIVWLVICILLSFVGALVWKPTNECTRFASSASLVSPVIFLGPLLLKLRARAISVIQLSAITAIIPLLSSAFVLFLLVFVFKQIWGM
jgi:hypothetical protein